MTRRAGLRVAVAARTRAQSPDVASRIAALGCPVTLVGKRDTTRPGDQHPAAVWSTSETALRTSTGVVIATTARWRYVDPATYTCDTLLIEKAWQSIFADFDAPGGLVEYAPRSTHFP